MKIIRDIQAKNKPIVRPTIKLQMRKKIISLGFSTSDVRAKEEENIEEMNRMEIQTKSIRESLMAEGNG